MKKVFIAIAFFVCVVLLISLLVFLEVKRQQAQNLTEQNRETMVPVERTNQATDINAEIEKWKVYRNEEHGYEMKYPPEWNLNGPYPGNVDAILTNGQATRNKDIILEILIGSYEEANLEDNIGYWRDNGLISVEEFELANLKGKKLTISNDLTINDGSGSGSRKAHNDTIQYLFRTQEKPTLFVYTMTGIDKTKDGELISVFNQILSTFKFVENNDLSDAETKKIRISDGDVAFSFEIPSDWLVETRHSGEKQLTIEEMRDFLAGNNIENLKNNPKEYSDYSDMPWVELEKMSEEEIKKLYNNNELFPNASVTSDSYIWYTDINWDQVDFYIKNGSVSSIIESEKSELENYCKNKSEYFVGCGLQAPTWSNETIDGLKTEVKNYYIDKDEEGNEIASKGGTGGKQYFIGIPNSSRTLIIDKQAKVEGEFENGFENLIKTFVFEK